MKYVYFRPDSLKDLIDEYRRAFELGDPTLVLYFPKNSPDMRVDQILQDHQSDFAHKLAKIELGSQQMETIEDIQLFFKNLQKTPTEKIGIFVTHAEQAILNGDHHLLYALIRYSKHNPHVSLIFFSGLDLTHPEIAKSITNQHLFSNIRFYPLNNREDAKQFIRYLMGKWNVEIETAFIDDLVDYFGGSLWLLKDAVRSVKMNGLKDIETIKNSRSMTIKIELIFQNLLETEKTVLGHVVRSDLKALPGELLHSYEHLDRVGILHKGKITIPALEQYIKSRQLKLSDIALTDNLIYINKVCINSALSKKEYRLMRILLQHKDEVVSRDLCAGAVWPINTDQFYTDWALDRIVSRLRAKILKFGIPTSTLSTIRKKGFQIKLIA